MTQNPGQEPLLDGGDFAETRDVADLNAPVDWRGLPAFEAIDKRIKLVLTFDDEAGRDTLIEQLGLVIAKKTGPTWSAWWPPRDRDDLAALRFDFDAPAREQGEPDLPPPDVVVAREAARAALAAERWDEAVAEQDEDDA